MLTVTITDGRGNTLAKGRSRGDWQKTAARLYNDQVCPGGSRYHVALVNAFPGGGTAHVQFGYWSQKANATSLSDRYVVHVEGLTF